MKKFFALMFALLILAINCSLCSAEPTIDFSNYSYEELMQIKEDLFTEIYSRQDNEQIILGVGQYKIGEAIPAGIYSFKFIPNGDPDITRTDYYVYENESMYKYDVDRLWLGDMPRVEDSLKGNGETRISLYKGEYLCLRYNGAVLTRIGSISDRTNDYAVPDGTTIPNGDYIIGEEIPAGTYTIYYSGKATSRVRIFEDVDEADNSFNKGKETVLDATNTEGFVLLSEGNVLRIEYTPIIMTKGAGFNFD